MKDTHLTLRLPLALSRALARRSRESGLPKSQVAREAVVRYLAGAQPESHRVVSGAELAARWPLLPHLDPVDAAAFGSELEASRNDLPQPTDPWE
jgi:hypothetical protein